MWKSHAKGDTSRVSLFQGRSGQVRRRDAGPIVDHQHVNAVLRDPDRRLPTPTVLNRVRRRLRRARQQIRGSVDIHEAAENQPLQRLTELGGIKRILKPVHSTIGSPCPDSNANRAIRIARPVAACHR